MDYRNNLTIIWLYISHRCFGNSGFESIRFPWNKKSDTQIAGELLAWREQANVYDREETHNCEEQDE